jgi:hypothetical protein
MTPLIPWGTITIRPESETFRTAYQMGREDYFDTCKGNSQRARTMSVEQVMGLVATRDASSGVYHFDDVANLAEEIIGFTLGYLGGAFLPQTPEERDEREHRYEKHSACRSHAVIEQN